MKADKQKRTFHKGILVKKEIRDHLKQIYPQRYDSSGKPYSYDSLADDVAYCRYGNQAEVGTANWVSKTTIQNFFGGGYIEPATVKCLFSVLGETFSPHHIEGNSDERVTCQIVHIGEKRAASSEKPEKGIIREGNGYCEEDSVNYWLGRFTSDEEPVRFLIINGDSGRGKTFFAKQLRYWLCQRQPDSRHAWLDCTSCTPSPYTLWQLFRQLVSGSEQEKLDHVFPKNKKDVHTESEFATGTNVAIYLQRTLLALDAPPLYLYLDDFDRYKYELGDTNHALASFIETFGQGDSCLRIIATSRDKDLDQELKKSLTGVEDLVGETGDALSLFQPQDTRKFLEYRGGVLQNLTEAEIEGFIDWVDGDPLLLAIIENEIKGKALPKHREWLLSLLAHGDDENVSAKERQSYKRGLVFEKQMSRLSKDGIKVANALAVLTDLEFNPLQLLENDNKDAFIAELLHKVVDGLTDPQISKHVKELQDRRILKPASYQFVIDSAQEFIYSSHHLLAGEKPTLHRRAKEAFWPEYPGFAIWHWMKTGKVEEAFDELCNQTYLLEAEFRYDQLIRLRKRFRLLLWSRGSGRWAINQGKLGETLYQGFDLTDTVDGGEFDGQKIPEQNEWQLISDAIKRYKAPDKYALLQPQERAGWHCDLDTYVRCLMLRAIFVFEKNVPEEAEWEQRANPRDWNWLASQSSIALLLLKDSNEVTGYKFPPLAANAACLQGCFYNGGGKLPEAIAAFKTSERILKEYEAVIRNASVISLEARLLRLEQDRMDLANSWSRSRFLLYGPDIALNGNADIDLALDKFKAFLDNSRSSLGSVQEYSYSLVDIGYYYIAKGDPYKLRDYLDQAYIGSSSNIDRPLYVDGNIDEALSELAEKPADLVAKLRRKKVYDSWSEGGIDWLEAAYLFYTADLSDTAKVEKVLKAFDYCAVEFDSDHFGYSRDEAFMRANRILVNMSVQSDMTGKRRVFKEFEDTLKKHSVMDEPIAYDLLGYLKAGLETEDGIPKTDPDGAVSRTKTRFPGLIGEGCPTIASTNWKSPILARGALLMRPNPCSPMPSELAASK